MYDDAWSASVSNQLTVLDDNLLALHLANFAVRQRQRWLLVQVGLMLELLLMKWLLGRVMLLMLITKILIVVVVVVGATAILMMTICVVVLVVSSVVLTVVLLLIMATDEVIVLVVRWNRSTQCTTSCRSCRRWWRYQYVVLIFRKVQIVVDVIVVAAVELLLQDTVGVLDRNWLVTTVIAAVCTIKVLILFQLVNQWTSLLLGVTTSTSSLMVILQYPSWTTVIVQLLIGLMRVVIVVTAATCRDASVGWFQLYVLAASTGLMWRLMGSRMLLGRNSLLRRHGVVVQWVEIGVVLVMGRMVLVALAVKV